MSHFDLFFYYFFFERGTQTTSVCKRAAVEGGLFIFSVFLNPVSPLQLSRATLKPIIVEPRGICGIKNVFMYLATKDSNEDYYSVCY